jgi:hypothetical protein
MRCAHEEPATGIRQGQAASIAVEQFGPETRLEILDALAKNGLRPSQRISRFVQVTQFSDAQEYLELLEIHATASAGSSNKQTSLVTMPVAVINHKGAATRY